MPNVDEPMVKELRQTVQDLAAQLRRERAEKEALRHALHAATVGAAQTRAV